MNVKHMQHAAFLDFLEQHPEIVAATTSRSQYGRTLAQRLWEECANLVNKYSLDGTIKTPQQMRMFFSDNKCRVYKKIAIAKKEAEMAGDGTDFKMLLTLNPLQAKLRKILERNIQIDPRITDYTTSSNPTSPLNESDSEEASELTTLHAPRLNSLKKSLLTRPKIIIIDETARTHDVYHRFAILMAEKIRSLNNEKKREDCMKLIRNVVLQFVENNKSVLPDASQSNFDASQSNFDASQSNFDASQSNFDASQSNFDVSQSNFDASQSNFDASQSNFDVSQSNFEDSVGSQQTQDEVSSERSKTEGFKKNDTKKDDVVFETDDDPPSLDNFEEVIELEHEIVSSKDINDYFNVSDDYQCLICSKTLDDGEDPRRHLEDKHSDVLENIIKNEYPDSDASSIKSIEEVDSRSETNSLPSKKRKSEKKFEEEPKKRRLSSTKEDHETKTKDEQNTPLNNSNDLLDSFLTYIKVLLINMPPDLRKKVQLNVLNVIFTA